MFHRSCYVFWTLPRWRNCEHQAGGSGGIFPLSLGCAGTLSTGALCPCVLCSPSLAMSSWGPLAHPAQLWVHPPCSESKLSLEGWDFWEFSALRERFTLENSFSHCTSFTRNSNGVLPFLGDCTMNPLRNVKVHDSGCVSIYFILSTCFTKTIFREKNGLLGSNNLLGCDLEGFTGLMCWFFRT